MLSKLRTIAVSLLLLISNRTLAQEVAKSGRINSLRPSDVFQFTNVWTIHLRFTPEQ